MNRQLARRLDTHLTTQPENEPMSLTKHLSELDEGNHFHFDDEPTTWTVFAKTESTIDIKHTEPGTAHRYILAQSLHPEMRVNLVGCEWCNNRGENMPLEILDDYPFSEDNSFQICDACMKLFHEDQAAEAAAEQAAEHRASMAFAFPGSHGPNAGPDPEDERERELENIYWDEIKDVPNYRPADHR